MKKPVIIALFTAAITVFSSTVPVSAITPSPLNIVNGVLDSECPEDLAFSFGETQLVIPIVVRERGGLLVSVRERCNDFYRSLNLQLFKNSSCTEPIGPSIVLSESFASGSIECVEAGTYFLRAELLRENESEQEMLFSLGVNFISSVNRSLCEGERVCCFGKTDYSLSLDQDGCVLFSFSGIDSSLDPSSVSLSLIGSCGIVQSGISDGCSTVLPLKKGSYCVRVHALVPCVLGYSFRSVSDSAISCEKETAQKIFLGGLYSGVSGNWFRFDLRSKRKVRMVCSEVSDSLLNFTLFDSQGSPVSIVSSPDGFKTTKKCKKGTYFLQVGESFSPLDCYSFVLK